MHSFLICMALKSLKRANSEYLQCISTGRTEREERREGRVASTSEEGKCFSLPSRDDKDGDRKRQGVTGSHYQNYGSVSTMPGLTN